MKIHPFPRSSLTKIVGPLDVGKVFACVGTVQALASLIRPIYNEIYLATLEWHAGFVYCIACAIIVGLIFSSVYVYVFMRINHPGLLHPEREEGNGEDNDGFDGNKEVEAIEALESAVVGSQPQDTKGG